MMTTQNLIAAFLSLALVSTASASQLRGANEQAPRELQAANLLNELTTVFIPSLSESVQTMAQEEYDPLVFGNETTQELVWSSADLDDYVNLTEPLPMACDASANVTMQPGELTGLGSIVVESIQLVPGTEDIQMQLMGLGGVTWEGVWVVDMSFAENLVLATTAALDGSLCGFPVQQTMEGTVSIVNVGATMKMFMAGTTGSIVVMRQSTAVHSVNMQEMDLSFDTVEVAMDSAGNSFNMDVDMSFFNEMMHDAILETIEPMMIGMMQESIDENLPFSP